MDHITQLPIDRLHESPFNPRQIFDQTAIEELAADIRAHGTVLQPLLVRPRIGPFFQGDPDADAAGHEIVFGHRRFRAAALAGLATVPCMVQSMTNEEARRAQISENLQRKDVHPIEEAQGFQALIDHDNETADTIAERFGKSRSYVYSRLKLLALVPDVRKACLAKEVDAEVALLIARLRTPELQNKALGYIKQEYRAKLDDGGKASYRTIRDLLNEKFTLNLDKAIFDLEDEMLVPDAGHCLRCTKRTGNAPEFQDVATEEANRHDTRRHFGANVCTDPDCFDAKKKAHLKRQADTLTAAGKVVVTGNAARSAISAHGEVKGAYIALKDVKAELKSLSAKKTVATGDPTPKTVLIQDPRTGTVHQAVKVADLESAGVFKQAPEPKRNSGGYDYEAAKREREQRDAKAQATTARNVQRLQRVRAALPPVPGLLELRLIANALYELIEDSDDSQVLHDLWQAEPRNLGGRIDTMAPAELTRLCIDCVLVGGVTATQWNDDSEPHTLLAVAAAHGIDVDADEPAAAAATPPPAARAPKNANAAPGGAP